MDETTIQTLIEWNHAFYQAFTAEFDQTRQTPWPGWAKLVPHLNASNASHSPVHRILDVGCGNGRFWRFLCDNLPDGVEYVGLDSSATLLERAPRHPRARFEERDVLANGLGEEHFSIITAFGFFHHIPALINRRRMLETMTSRLHDGGLLIVAFWQFAAHARFDTKTIPWPQELDRESGDYLLKWSRGGQGKRYCHYVDEAEETKLFDGLDLTIVDRFLADGKSNDLNRYVIARKSE